MRSPVEIAEFVACASLARPYSAEAELAVPVFCILSFPKYFNALPLWPGSKQFALFYGSAEAAQMRVQV